MTNCCQVKQSDGTYRCIQCGWVCYKPKRRNCPKAEGTTPKPNSVELGDLVESALKAVGITEERVTKWLGRPCRCPERKEKLNRLHRWAKRVLLGRTENAEQYLEEMVSDN